MEESDSEGRARYLERERVCRVKWLCESEKNMVREREIWGICAIRRGREEGRMRETGRERRETGREKDRVKESA